MQQKVYRYSIGPKRTADGQLTITIRRLPTGSRVVFMDLSSRRIGLPVLVTLRTPSVRKKLVDLGLRPNLKYDSHTGIDRMAGPIGWAEFGNGSTLESTAFLSRAYRYKTLVRRYSSTKRSVVRALVSESRSVGWTTTNGRPALKLGLYARKDTCQRYMVISNRSIPDTSTKPYSVGKITAEEWGWLDPAGSYGKGPYGIEPYTRVGYVRSLLDMRAGQTREAYRATGSSLFEDLMTSNLYALAITRPADGLWRSQYTSSWVKKESGIVAPYIDTRHNEALALASKRTTDELTANGVTGLAGVRTWTTSFAKFLVGRARAGAVVRTKNGLLFGDYYGSSGSLASHTSLNHALGEMNYLFDMYQETSSTPYLTHARLLKGGIDDTGLKWIRPNHDLWYQRNLSGTYCGDDYPTVTYFDLLASRTRLATILNETDPVIEALLASKAKYLGLSPSQLTTDSALPDRHVLSPANLPSRHELP
jgi:hypothetical protein